MSEVRFSPRVARILQHADQVIRAQPAGDYSKVYDFLRATMGKIAPVDSFYVGLYRDDALLAFPYTFDGSECEAPGVHTFGERGLGAWLRREKRTYVYAMDNGRLLSMGHRFGDTSKIARDAIAVPLIEPVISSDVFGMASMQSYGAAVYSDETIRAFEWMCATLVVVLRRQREDLAHLRSVQAASAHNSGSEVVDAILAVTERLETLRAEIAAIRALDHPDPDTVAARLDTLHALCTRLQDEVFAIVTAPATTALEPLALLTTRERQVADLLGQRLTNNEIADALHISLRTVKSHVYSVMQKFGAQQRSEVAAKMLPLWRPPHT